MTLQSELAEVVAETRSAHGVPGVAAGVLVGDELTVATHGVTNVEHPLPVTSATLSQVASITKTFTSAACALLVEAGKLRFEDPVDRHLPGLAAATGLDLGQVTVEHLLSHQSGFDGDHLFVNRSDDLGSLSGARRLFPPGTGFSYSNAGFSLAGAVVEAVCGQPFDRFVTDRLLRPLGMANATFRADDAITHSVFAPHWVLDGDAHVIRRAGWQPGWEMGPNDRAAAGLVASVDHLAAWCRFQRTGTDDEGHRLLGDESLARLHTPVVNADRTEDIALDWAERDSGGARSIGHGGVTAGYISDLVIVPDHDVAVIGLTNATNGAIVNQTIRRWALQRVAGLVERDPEPDPTSRPDAASYLGCYLHPFADLTVAAGDLDATLVVSAEQRDIDGWRPPADEPVTCGFLADDHIVSLDHDETARVGRFGLDGDGRAEWLLWGGRRALRAPDQRATAGVES